MTNLKTIALSAAAIAVMNGCGDTTVNQAPSDVTIIGDTTTTTTTGTDGTTGTDTTINDIADAASLDKVELAGNISQDMTLTKDTLWQLSGQVVIMSGVTLTIEPGTVIAGLPGTADNASWMLVDAGAKIIADGTADEPIIFTSQQRVDYPSSEEAGQWGGLTIIGNAGNSQVQGYEVDPSFEAGMSDLADNSGILRHVKILNSGAAPVQDQEINGLSMVGVGSGTVVENITVDYSSDDGIELWGGTVNLTNITITNCEDDYLDLDDGYAGTIKNLVINTTIGKAGIEMTGDTYATIDGFTITTGEDQEKEGGIYFKEAGVGGHFKNGTIIHNGGQITADGAIFAKAGVDTSNISFENVGLIADTNLDFTGDSAVAVETVFNAGTNNSSNCTIPGNLVGNMTGCNILTADQIWEIDGQVVMTSGSSLRIQEGTTLVGLPGAADNASWMAVDVDAKIYALGTEAAPIIFTSEDQTPASGQWGGLTIIGNAGNAQVQPYEVDANFEAGMSDLADNSGILRHVKILNSGAAPVQDQEINGLSMVGVGSGTVVENITVDYSNDDGIELWGGTVNLTNISLSNCGDDYLDLDDGYDGEIKNLVINTTTGAAGIEMTGNTYARFDGFTITTGVDQPKEGGIYFKEAGVGGHFKNGTIIHNGGQIEPHGAIHSNAGVDTSNVSFNNVAVTTGTDLDFTGDSAAALETVFNAGSGNSITYN